MGQNRFGAQVAAQLRSVQFSTLVLIAALILLLSKSIAGELAGQQVTAGVNYQFNECQRPADPLALVHDYDSYVRASSEYNSYAHEVNAYLSCIKAEALRDIDVQTKTITQAYEDEAELMKLKSKEIRDQLLGWERNL
ncbi:MAG: hypothetical protein ACWA5L_00760 [bacterium]